MQAILDLRSDTPTRSATATTWAARIFGSLLALFLLVDGAGKVLRFAPYVEGTARVGYPASCLVPLGLVLVACTILYVVPRTSVLGTVLLTGYLGGATATHVRMGEPFVFPVVFGVLLWACLYVRDARVRSLILPRPPGTSGARE
ncbi:MAG TPA: DoxX family protein [Polyangiaceae bacterium]